MPNKVKKVMGEYKRGTLHSGSKKGPKVKSRKQAVAIALSEQRRAKTRERKLSSQERARFSRTSAIGNNSLATRGLGTQ